MIKIRGIRNFKDEEKTVIDRILPEYNKKFIRDIKSGDITVHFKKNQKKDSPKARYSITARLNKPKLEASSLDWKLNNALHKVLKKLENEIKHRFRDNK